MKEHETVDCSYLVNYLTGDCTELDRAAFERHLRTCVTCREELSELQAVWQALPFEMEEVEVPSDLKQQVMQSIIPPQLKAIKKKKKRSFKWVYGGAAAIILGLAVGIWWNNQPNNTTLSANPGLQQPAEIVHTFQLKSVESTMPTASGTAWVLQNGDIHNVVINLQGLKETEGDWAYQVWFNRSGKRYNCGTLHVDEKGTGVLTYSIPVKVKDFQIDSFGVTLEPDPNGLQPRGKKILGTS
ncbi:Putative zinc-finger [Paenibacillus sp. yr247]|uniref:anti-sigma factor n=1 Tax=Paenibacillus sp. yr247 TaxID=1761880 RepID=UPI00088E3069|nr:anti-sigma factor [Paenibacillus sp. yr247]SDN36535.1 Putative zinc-finger [Paenibacillus sp. yr247]